MGGRKASRSLLAPEEEEQDHDSQVVVVRFFVL